MKINEDNEVIIALEKYALWETITSLAVHHKVSNEIVWVRSSISDGTPIVKFRLIGENENCQKMKNDLLTYFLTTHLTE